MNATFQPFALPDHLGAEGFSCLTLPETGSTNADALAALSRGEDRVFIVADRQTGGRGRHGRPWASPPGNLYMSLALASPCPPAVAPLLGFVAGVSLAEAVLAVAPGLKPVLHLKWPNDLLLSGGKLSGLLLEGTTLPGGRNGVVIGIGVNVAGRPEGVEQTVAVLKDHARGADAAMLFAQLSVRLAANLALFDEGRGFAEVRQRWLAHAMPMGTPIRVKLPAGEQRGTFAGLDEHGQLLMAQDGIITRVLVGDVFPLLAPLSPEEALRHQI
ncbi:MAG: biotin--[acetyl-CoA-carboxylase] ligase [Proteobacteria bacterium]|nr:biotin--[acetyl-CoA-carboxylase] ligase [Pseudomonadota bacterium]